MHEIEALRRRDASRQECDGRYRDTAAGTTCVTETGLSAKRLIILCSFDKKSM
jgi:hypothetical protein